MKRRGRQRRQFYYFFVCDFSVLLYFFGSFYRQSFQFFCAHVMFATRDSHFIFFFLIFIFFFFCGVTGLKPTSVTQAGASAVLQDLSDVLQAEHCRVTQELLAWPNIFIMWKHYICNRLDIHWLMGLEVNPVFHAQLDITAISELHDDNSNAI